MNSPITAEAIVALINELQIIETPDEITVDTDLFASGLDSMALMQLLVHLEDRFQVTIAPADITRERFFSAKALASFLSEKNRDATL